MVAVVAAGAAVDRSAYADKSPDTDCSYNGCAFVAASAVASAEHFENESSVIRCVSAAVVDTVASFVGKLAEIDWWRATVPVESVRYSDMVVRLASTVDSRASSVSRASVNLRTVSNSRSMRFHFCKRWLCRSKSKEASQQNIQRQKVGYDLHTWLICVGIPRLRACG